MNENHHNCCHDNVTVFTQVLEFVDCHGNEVRSICRTSYQFCSSKGSLQRLSSAQWGFYGKFAEKGEPLLPLVEGFHDKGFKSWTPQPLPVYTKIDEKDSSIHQYQASQISSCTNAQRPRSPLATSPKNWVPLDWHFHLQVLQLGSTVKLSEESIRTILSR